MSDRRQQPIPKTPYVIRARPAGTSRQQGKTKPHIRPGELDVVLAKIRFQLETGRSHEAVGSLQHFIRQKRAGHSEFAGFRSFAELPIALASTLPDRELGFLEEAEIFTAGQLDQIPDDELMLRPGFDAKRVSAIRGAVEKLRSEFEAWKDKQNPRRKRPERKGPA